MTPQNTMSTLMFADIVGSTRLYDRLGDAEARRTIATAFAIMSNVIHAHGGTVVKTIGDEIMCRFEAPGAAASAARDIQEGFRGPAAPTPVPISVRIGLHHGPVILEKDDVFGDAVNIAARMAGIARPEQIITTEDTIRAFDAAAEIPVRRFDRVRVKGKSEPITLYEILWTSENLTQMVPTDFPSVVGDPPKTLRINYRDTAKQMTLQSPPFLLGRNTECDLVVKTSTASRIHARIEHRRGKFILLDTSTNGTYARTTDSRELYLRREELVILGPTTLSLGMPIIDGSADLIRLSF